MTMMHFAFENALNVKPIVRQNSCSAGVRRPDASSTLLRPEVVGSLDFFFVNAGGFVARLAEAPRRFVESLACLSASKCAASVHSKHIRPWIFQGTLRQTLQALDTVTSILL
eukprot:m.383373 g.383373  ORF g.383373 m.383373 type:complete len:112 (+) comp56258_c0_seq25:1634-1969(+)